MKRQISHGGAALLFPMGSAAVQVALIDSGLTAEEILGTWRPTIVLSEIGSAVGCVPWLPCLVVSNRYLRATGKVSLSQFTQRQRPYVKTGTEGGLGRAAVPFTLSGSWGTEEGMWL
ncbi:unnamed protein product [Pleuronectes platessa]|uniref:Uncharacterized protein n=1 Tax=Pleuronectes platessa TaxID=8262 RepID=A0A9N7Z8A1_PLEPL|nr:unnamed protein product [Pleuronectes platessa]